MYERLHKLTLEGDKEAAEALLPEAHRRGDDVTWFDAAAVLQLDPTTHPFGPEAELRRQQRLLEVMTGMSNAIHAQTLRGSANWIVTSPEVARHLGFVETHHRRRFRLYGVVLFALIAAIVITILWWVW